MVIASLAVVGALDAGYPLMLAGTYLAVSIISRLNCGQNLKITNSAISIKRANWIFWFLILLCLDLVGNTLRFA